MGIILQLLCDRYEDWKESEKFRKLHLSSHAKCKVARELIKIFDNLKKSLWNSVDKRKP